MRLPTLHGERLILRPLDAEDIERLAEIVASPGVSEWWSPPDDPEHVREGLRNDGAAFGIEVEGALVGWLAFHDETDRDWRATGIDLFLAPDYQGRGLGPQALRTVIRWLAAQRGCERFTIDPAVDNQRAIAAYTSVGFRSVGVMREVERGADGRWRDNLLMDLLDGELRD
ncbi:MAG TPA: GNAT family protein [Thermoleophilaceae bacterium]|nr:GNAT family protein [Thermoleophilaceae bacterium]